MANQINKSEFSSASYGVASSMEEVALQTAVGNAQAETAVGNAQAETAAQRWVRVVGSELIDGFQRMQQDEEFREQVRKSTR